MKHPIRSSMNYTSHFLIKPKVVFEASAFRRLKNPQTGLCCNLTQIFLPHFDPSPLQPLPSSVEWEHRVSGGCRRTTKEKIRP